MSPEEQHPIIIHPGLDGEVTDADPQWIERGPDRRVYVTAASEAPSPAPEELAAPESPKRAFSLDALRGLFLISMTLGFTISRHDFPLWMYHRQLPPPNETLVAIPGISWRDLAYGAFLFTMSAALPLTLSRRIEKGETEIAIIVAMLRRYALLLLFALLVAHSNPFFLGYTNTARVLAISGFAIMTLVYTRRRPDWDAKLYRVWNRAGYALAVAFLAFTPLLYGKAFSFDRIDGIISGLAVASLTGSIVWYFTRENLVARLGVLAVAIALYLGAKGDGWIQSWWYSSPFSWAFEPSQLVLLTIVIPGTIAGDTILRWMRSRPVDSIGRAWSRGRVVQLSVLGVALTPIVVFGLYNRYVELTTEIVIALVAAGVVLTWKPFTPTERMLRTIFTWAAVWLVIGLLLDPFEGGIKKEPDTLSYYFTIAGLTTMLLVTLSAVIDVFKRRQIANVLIDVGHNPLLTYVLFTVLINSIIELTPFRDVLNASPGEAILRSVIEVVLVVAIVRAVSRRRIYWRT